MLKLLSQISQILDEFGLSPEKYKRALESVRQFMAPSLTEQSRDRIAEFFLTEPDIESNAIFNERGTGRFQGAIQPEFNALEDCEERIEEIVWLYALLSSQPTLSERAAQQISQILDLATTNETLAFLLNEIDRLILESTDLLSDEAQHQYANQASRILEFLAPSPDSENSEQLFSMLSDQCAEIAASDSKQTEAQEPGGVRSNATANLGSTTGKANPTARSWVKVDSQCYIFTALCIASAAIAAITTTLSQQQTMQSRSNTLVEQVRTILIDTRTSSTKMNAIAAGGIKPSFFKSEAPKTVQTVNVVQQMVEDQQSKFEDEQRKFERKQYKFEQAQHQAEYYQMVAESQHQYEDAQRWYEEARRNLQLSKKMKAQAQEELKSAQRLSSDSEQASSVSNLSHPRQPKLDQVLMQNWFVIASLISWMVFALMSLLLVLTCVDLRKREFG